MLNLYRVTLRGFTSNNAGYKTSYVVASNSDVAYQTIRRHLDEKDYGFSDDRALDKVELLAEDTDYPPSKARLFLETKT